MVLLLKGAGTLLMHASFLLQDPSLSKSHPRLHIVWVQLTPGTASLSFCPSLCSAISGWCSHSLSLLDFSKWDNNSRVSPNSRGHKSNSPSDSLENSLIWGIRTHLSSLMHVTWGEGMPSNIHLTTCFFNLNEFFTNTYSLEEDDSLRLTELVSQCFNMFRKALAFRTWEVLDNYCASNRGLSCTRESLAPVFLADLLVSLSAMPRSPSSFHSQFLKYCINDSV